LLIDFNKIFKKLLYNT